MNAFLQTQLSDQGLQLLIARRAAPHQHQMQLRIAIKQGLHGSDQFMMAFFAPQYGNAAYQHGIRCQAQLGTQIQGWCRIDHAGINTGVDHLDVLGFHTALDQVIAHIVAGRDYPLGHDGVRHQGTHFLGQMARAHNQGSPRQTPGHTCQHGIATTMAVQHIKLALTQHPAQLAHTAHVIGRAIHQQGMNNEALVAQALGQLCMRLAGGLHLMPPLAQDAHGAQDVVFLAAKAGGSFRVQNAQGPHR